MEGANSPRRAAEAGCSQGRAAMGPDHNQQGHEPVGSACGQGQAPAAGGGASAGTLAAQRPGSGVEPVGRDGGRVGPAAMCGGARGAVLVKAGAGPVVPQVGGRGAGGGLAPTDHAAGGGSTAASRAERRVRRMVLQCRCVSSGKGRYCS